MKSEAGSAQVGNGAASLGRMGLAFTDVSDVMQAMAYALVERGHDERYIRERLERWSTEDQFAFFDAIVGPAIDELAEELGVGHPITEYNLEQ